MTTYQLMLADRSRVVWDGRTGEEAARSYAAHSGSTVIAWRHWPRTKIVEHFAERMDRVRILEPGDIGWGA